MNKGKEWLADYWQSTRTVTDKKVIEAFLKVPREFFVLSGFEKEAYADVPLPIHAEQTISQPTTVAIMLEALELKEGMKVLEIGAGSGYNAALIATIVGKEGKVYTMEFVKELADFAQKNLKRAGINNAVVVHGDGSKGFERRAPYDRIIVTAAAPSIPEALAKQLKEGGIIVIPVGDAYMQHVVKARKVKGKLETQDLGEFIFVPLKGKYGLNE